MVCPMPKVLFPIKLLLLALLHCRPLAAQDVRSGLFPLIEPVRRLNDANGRDLFTYKLALAPTPRLVQNRLMFAFAEGKLRRKTVKELFHGPNPPEDYLLQEQDKVYLYALSFFVPPLWSSRPNELPPQLLFDFAARPGRPWELTWFDAVTRVRMELAERYLDCVLHDTVYVFRVDFQNRASHVPYVSHYYVSRRHGIVGTRYDDSSFSQIIPSVLVLWTQYRRRMGFCQSSIRQH